MTEPERMLKDTLVRMERDFSTGLNNQGKALAEQQRDPAAQGRSLNRLQAEAGRINADWQGLTRRLQGLAGIVRELGTALVALEQAVERRMTERAHKRSRGPGLRMQNGSCPHVVGSRFSGSHAVSFYARFALDGKRYFRYPQPRQHEQFYTLHRRKSA
jgi:hypothetical protein